MERFHMKTAEDLQHIRDTKIDGKIPENTMKNTNWALATWNKWAEWRNKAQTDEMPEVPQAEDLHDLSDDSLSTFLSLYVCEVKRENGSYYTPDTLYNLVCGLNRYLKIKKGRSDINFFEDRGPFAEFKKTMDGQIINLSRQETVCMNRRVTETVTEEQEAVLWDKSIFSLNTAQGLSYAAFHYISKDFGLKGRDRHRELKAEHFAFGEDRVGKYVEYLGNQPESETPTSKFGLINRSRGKPVKKRKMTRCYEDQLNPISLYTILQTYLSYIPTQGCFYRKPMPPSAFEQVRFAEVPIGKNTLGEYTKTFMCQAGFEGNYTSQMSGDGTPKEPTVLAKKMLEIIRSDDRDWSEINTFMDSPMNYNCDSQQSTNELVRIKQEEASEGNDDGNENETSINDDDQPVVDDSNSNTAALTQPLTIGIGQPFSISPADNSKSTPITTPDSIISSITNTYRKIESKDRINSTKLPVGQPLIVSPLPNVISSLPSIENKKRKLEASCAEIKAKQHPTVLAPAIGIPVSLYQASSSCTFPKPFIPNVNSQVNGVASIDNATSSLSSIDRELKQLKKMKYSLEIEQLQRMANTEKESLEMKKLEKVKISLEIDKLRLEKEKLELEVNSLRCEQATNL